MKKFVNNWYNISVYLASATALFAILLPIGMVQKLLLTSVSILFLHFFEEFGWPGGFPYMGVKTLLGSDEMDLAKWNCNNLSSLFGNWTFLLLVYLLPIFIPGVRFLTIGVFIFNFAELLMHLLLFNIRLKTGYNAGMISAVFGLSPISLYYFFVIFHPADYLWWDFVLAAVYFIIIFWFCFRSPLYWNLGKKVGYEFTEQSAFGRFDRIGNPIGEAPFEEGQAQHGTQQ